ncbi:hypothetical protein H6P81_001648 [Aristolochia fimbriata]|uniref:Uncharacterized protein n=1 Tax=Aristolochia fimbriata TaxID=158543 RepID=A0AAV7F7G7_ARIFI|nr:hypothetical protein H6P81_001648 [Aristolochia fimbriata]
MTPAVEPRRGIQKGRARAREGSASRTSYEFEPGHTYISVEMDGEDVTRGPMVGERTAKPEKNCVGVTYVHAASY